MVTVSKSRKVFLVNGENLVEVEGSADHESVVGAVATAGRLSSEDVRRRIPEARRGTIASGIMRAHSSDSGSGVFHIRFDSIASHDITYVGIIQTARASGMREFPLPYVLTNCHNSLCAVGGTINEDDHRFGLSAARKYGGIYVPTHQAVIHQYMRERMAGCGRMILGSDSHTRYGAIGTMGIGEGGPELVKQLLGRTYDISTPEVVAVYLQGEPGPGVGPQDVALSIIAAVFESGFVKNRVMEFVGPGIASLSMDFRNGIDVMTTETTCLSSIWTTDDRVREYLEAHGRPDEFAPLAPEPLAEYDGLIRVELDKVEPMIALPFHPSTAVPIREVNADPKAHLEALAGRASGSVGSAGPRDTRAELFGKIRDGRLVVDQGVVAGCAGGMYENISVMAEILAGGGQGGIGPALSVYPASMPVMLGLMKAGVPERLLAAGVVMRSAFCGPCFGAGDVPSDGSLSIRHTTRNFPNREGSRPQDGQAAYVALMDARSIAATVAAGGVLTPATEVPASEPRPVYSFDARSYEHSVYDGCGSPEREAELAFGPNIMDWPEMPAMPENLLLRIAAYITDPVTTTDELIPSGETSSYRSNPLKLAEFTLSRRDPGYTARAAESRVAEGAPFFERAVEQLGISAADRREFWSKTGVGSLVAARKPGDGSAREQAASCQKVLGGWANVAEEYATKRYRSNLVNWGLIPFTVERLESLPEDTDAVLYLPGVREAVESGKPEVCGTVISGDTIAEIGVSIADLTENEREILLAGCLMNHYRKSET
jgi:aconitate hydratase